MYATQNNIVLNHLRTRGKLTQRQAMKEYGIMRLGARIYDLREHGYNIVKDMETSKNRYGKRVCYAAYRLKEDENEQNHLDREYRVGHRAANDAERDHELQLQDRCTAPRKKRVGGV